MKKFKHLIFLTALAVTVFATQHQTVASDVTIEQNDSSAGGLMGRPSMPERGPGYDERLNNSKYIVEIREELVEALDIHGFASSMIDNLTLIEGLKSSIRSYEHALAMLKGNISCNIGLLTPYYNNPAEVWEKISTWAYNTEKEGAAQIEALRKEISDAAKEIGDDYRFDNDLMSKNMILARNSWDIGHRVLSDVYANQSKWGSKRYPFPLWGDQQYLYDSQWNTKYGLIKKALVEAYSTQIYEGDSHEPSCLLEEWVLEVPDRGPAVAAVYKYDHEDYDPKLGTQGTLQAHNEYVKLIKKVPPGVNLSVMTSPPPQLPPVKEAIFQYLWTASNDIEKLFTAYPGLPNIWKELMASDYVFFNQGREDHFYNPQPSSVCPAFYHVDALGAKKYATELGMFTKYYSLGITAGGPDPLPSTKKRVNFKGFLNETGSLVNNRVQTYLDNRLYEEMMRPLWQSAKVELPEFISWMKGKFEKFGIELKDGFDLSNLDDYNAALSELLLKRNEHIAAAREAFDGLNPVEEELFQRDIDQYKTFGKVFETLEFDPEMVVRIDFDSLDDVPERVLQANADIAANWETIEMMRKPPEYPTLGCPIY